MNLLDLLGYAGNLVDLPGSSVRDLLSGRNPLDQWRTPFSSENRATGRDVLEPFLGANQETGMAGWLDNPMEGLRDVAGFGAEMLLDPLNLVPGGAMMKALRNRKAIKTANAAAEAANRGRYGFVNARLMADGSVPAVKEVVPEIMDVPVSPMAAGPRGLPMYPEPDRFQHGGQDWSKSATPEYPYGRFDFTKLKSADGTNYYGPALYKSDEGADATTDFYLNLVRDSSGDFDTDQMAELWNRVSTEVLPPGKFVPFDDNASPALRELMEVTDGVERRSDAAFLFTGDGEFEELVPEGAVLKGIIPEAFDLSNVQGPELKYKGVWETPDGSQVTKDMSENLGFDLTGWAVDVMGKPIDIVKPQARKYGFELPAGTKDRYLNWDATFDEQPEAVRREVVRRLLSTQPNANIDEVVEAIQQNRAAVRAYQELLHNAGADLYSPTPNLANELRAARQSMKKLEEVLAEAGLTDPVAWSVIHGRGENVAEVLMGGHPSKARVKDVLPLAEAGIPGIKNLARSTGRSTFNYATWDPNLLDQLRIRSIDGERVPINPTTLVTSQPRRVIPQPADPEMMEVLNPMSLKPVPGLGFPAAVGAVYNALARSNSYGGLQ